MEISNLKISSIGTYKKLTKQTAVKKKETSGAGTVNNTDKIEFDFARSLQAAKAGAAARVNEPAGEDRIAALRNLYAGDNCPVSAEEVARAIIA